MVTRTSSIPLPSHAPPPVPDTSMSTSRHVQSSDVARHAQQGNVDSPFADMGNPWQEESVVKPAQHLESGRSDAAAPSFEQPTTSSKISDRSVPDILKPGRPGQITPRSSIDSDRSKDFWESSDDEDDHGPKQRTTGVKLDTRRLEDSPSSGLPTSLRIKRKPVSPSLSKNEATLMPQQDFASNNPFRQQFGEVHQDAAPTADDKGKGKESRSDYQSSVLAQFPSLQIGKPLQSHPVPSYLNSAHGLFPWDDVRPDKKQQSEPNAPQTAPPPVPVQPPPALPQLMSPFSSQPPLIPVLTGSDVSANPWAAADTVRSAQPSPLPQQKAVYANDLLDRGGKTGRISLGDELTAVPNHAPPSTTSGTSSVSPLIAASPSRGFQYPTDLQQDGQHSTSLAPGHKVKALANPAAGGEFSFSLLDESPPLQAQTSQPLLRDNNNSQAIPPAKLRTQNLEIAEEIPPVKPPRPAQTSRPLTEAEITQMQEQRNETYQIKHFQWFDHRMSKLRSSSMLTQNKNGPCPLLALVNALILGARDQDQAILDDFLSTREQVTLGTIIENLMMELLSSSRDGDLPDVDVLNRFLLKLRTGMNMNPRLVQPLTPAPNLMDARMSVIGSPDIQKPQLRPGGFEPTQDIELYNTFQIPTVHGWLSEPDTDAATAFRRSAQNYEDAQAKLFGEEELEYKLTQNGLTADEQIIWEDIISMKNFFAANPTQLTPYGLYCIQSTMKSGTFAILFRNDHFSTIYKHPRDGQLYTLITDAGFADRAEIIWESLVDVSGQHSEFFSGDFMSVSHGETRLSTDAATTHRQQITPLGGNVDGVREPQAPLSPIQRQEQEDADLAMAMQLQEEEEQRHERERAASQSANTNTSTNQPNRTTGRRQSGNIPITLNSTRNNPSQEVRPLVPARNARSNVQAVNRSSDAAAADAPPAYEEAARGKPYNPPLGSPLHPHSSPSGSGSVDRVQATGTMSRPYGPDAGARVTRRSSAYNENSNRLPQASPAYDFTDGTMPGSYVHTGHGGHGQSAQFSSTGPMGYPGGGPHSPLQGRHASGRDRDCTVM